MEIRQLNSFRWIVQSGSLEDADIALDLDASACFHVPTFLRLAMLPLSFPYRLPIVYLTGIIELLGATTCGFPV